MSDDTPTQRLSAIEPEPAPPKSTLASLIVDRLERVEMATDRAGQHVNDVYVKLNQALAQGKLLLFLAIATLAFLVLAVGACLVFEAMLVGHVR